MFRVVHSTTAESEELMSKQQIRLGAFSRRLFSLPLLCLACVLGLLLATPRAHAIPVARLRNIMPEVQVRPAGRASFVGIRERSPLLFGDIVRTGRGAKCDLIFGNGTQVAMRQNSSLEILPPSRDRQGLGVRVFGALSEVFVRSHGNTKIVTAAAVAAARGTAYLVRLPTADTTELTVTEHSVDFSNVQGAVLVAEGQQSTAHVGSAPTPPVAVDVTGMVAWTADITGLPVELETPFSTTDPQLLQTQLQQRRQTVQANPQASDAHEQLGETYYDLGQYAAAVAEFRRALELSPHNGAALLGLGQARRGQGDVPGALQAYQDAQTALPESALPRIGTALAQLSAGRNQEAATILRGINDNSLAQSALGLAELRAGDNAAATRDLQAVTAAPGAPYQAHALLALAYLTQNQLAPAQQAARRAVQLQPNSAQAQGTLSMVEFFADQTAEAAKAARRSTELNPLSPFALITQGRIELSQLHTDAARDRFQQAVALAPNLPLTHLELGNVYTRLDMLPKAEAEYRRAIELNPNSAEAHTGLGTVLQRQGQTEAALAEHQAALRLDPNNSTARYNLAVLYIEQGDLEAAQRELEQGTAVTPERGVLYARLAEISLYRQNLSAAMGFARRGVALAPRAALAHYELGRVYLEQQRTFQAEQEFRQAVTLDREFAEARYALGYTQELVLTGRDPVRPSSNISSAILGSAAAAASLQNLQSPGAEQRFQAAIQDPTVVRSASRSYGDNQVEGLLGDDSTRDLSISHLQEIGRRRGVFGINGEHFETDGPRANSDTKDDRASVIYGQKVANNRSAVFVMAQGERVEEGLNKGDLGALGATGQSVVNKPTVVAGANLQSSENSRTRFLLQYVSPHSSTNGLAGGAFNNVNFQDWNGEVRHDRHLGMRHYLNGGLSATSIHRETNSLLPGLPPIIPDFLVASQSDLHAYTAYLRDEVTLRPNLSVTGELKAVKTDIDSSFQIVPAPSINAKLADRTSVLPTFIVSYLPGARSSLHFRARRLRPFNSSFDLLAPTDVFLLTFENLPRASLVNGGGRSYELEYDYTFSNASFLRLGAYDRRLTNAQELSLDGSGAMLPKVKIRGLQAGYEGILSRDITYFANLNFNDAQDEALQQEVANVPHFVGEVGAQYLNPQGWFLRSAYLYQGNRTRLDRTEAGGFGLFNVRIGKRFGLRSTLFAEVVNLFDKQYDVLERVQPGRQFRIGASKRF
jgi:tetratricopeptide (TPR) repeat protein